MFAALGGIDELALKGSTNALPGLQNQQQQNVFLGSLKWTHLFFAYSSNFWEKSTESCM